MRIILRNDIGKLGAKHDIVTVSDGYARNFLIPRGLAEVATPEKEAAIERTRAERAAKEKERIQALKDALSSIAEQGVTINGRANDQGNLFCRASYR
jgi:large subunit ribosomal protein L9